MVGLLIDCTPLIVAIFFRGVIPILLYLLADLFITGSPNPDIESTICIIFYLLSSFQTG